MASNVPLKAYRARLRNRDVFVWTIVFWPVMAVAAWLLADPVGGEAILVEALLLVLPVLFILARPATVVLPEGIRVVPYLTLARTYPWTDIEGFQNDVRGHSRGGQPIYSVRMYLSGGNRRWLPSLGNHAQAIAELYAFRQQHGSWAAAPQEALPPPPNPPRRTYRWAQVLIGCLLLALGLLLATGGIAASVEQTRLATSGVVVMATITATQPKTCSKSGCTCPMSWSFTAGSGITYDGSTGTCSSLYDQAEPGVMIPVVYDPSDPTINQPDDMPPNPAGAAAAGSLFGYLVLGAGVAAVIGPLRKRTKRSL